MILIQDRNYYRLFNDTKSQKEVGLYSYIIFRLEI